jgi:epoxyqueuosine reductase
MTSSDTSHITVQQLDLHELKAWIKAQALDLGFADCVIAKP